MMYRITEFGVFTLLLLLLPGAFSAATKHLKAEEPLLFDFETKQLTDSALEKLPSRDRKLFGFDSSAVNSTAEPSTKKGECKAFPDDDTWPTKEIWDRLNESTGGALIPTIPLAAPCYGNWGRYDAAKCAEIAKNFTNPYSHEADPTSNMWPIFQGRTCLPFDRPNGTCSLGSFPAYAVNVSSVAHIQLALNFARNSNIRLVIKNTGHDYLGKSLGAGALSIWTHNLKDIEFVEKYESDSGYVGSVMKIGAGVTVREVYKAAHKYSVTVLGGICESVGYAGGYIAGGGHTPMSGYYGMAADNVEALQVITADGRFVTASNTSNPDLYWALRGGGGSTFGVVTSVLVRAHPKMPIVTSSFTFETGGNVTKEVFWEGLRKFFEMFITFSDAHTYSYFWVWQQNGGMQFQLVPFFAPNHTIASFNALIKPWFDRLNELGISFTPKMTLYDSFYPAYNDNWGNDSVGSLDVVTGNHLFPQSNWEDAATFEKTFAAVRDLSMKGHSLGGYNQAPRNRMNVDNAVSSAFRHVLAFLIGGGRVEHSENATAADIKRATDTLTYEVLAPWREVAPASAFGGAYLNEANIMEPGWQESFYGTQYARLLELKRKWDPKGVLYATTAVGSEGWEVRDGDQGTQTQNGRLCRL